MRRRFYSVLLNLGIIIGCLITAIPFIWMLSSSFKTNAEIHAVSQSFFPTAFSLTNYQDVLTKFSFLGYFLNSLVYAVVLTVITVYTSTLSGFVLSKYEFRGKQLLFSGILMTMMVPATVTIIPRYSIMQTLGWLDTYKALILPGAFSAFGIFLMRQACFSIPDEMLEAARIDGANEFYVFWRIVLPQLQNSIVTFAIFQFLFAWDDYLWPYLITRNSDRHMLSVALNLFSGRHSTDYAGLFAATSIAVIPVIVVYVVFQRRFIEGISSSSLKT